MSLLYLAHFFVLNFGDSYLFYVFLLYSFYADDEADFLIYYGSSSLAYVSVVEFSLFPSDCCFNGSMNLPSSISIILFATSQLKSLASSIVLSLICSFLSSSSASSPASRLYIIWGLVATQLFNLTNILPLYSLLLRLTQPTCSAQFLRSTPSIAQSKSLTLTLNTSVLTCSNSMTASGSTLTLSTVLPTYSYLVALPTQYMENSQQGTDHQNPNFCHTIVEKTSIGHRVIWRYFRLMRQKSLFLGWKENRGFSRVLVGGDWPVMFLRLVSRSRAYRARQSCQVDRIEGLAVGGQGGGGGFGVGGFAEQKRRIRSKQVLLIIKILNILRW